MNNRIRSVGITGEGKMGTNLFYHLLDLGFELTWVCSREADVEKISRTFGKKARRLSDAGIISESAMSALLSGTIITASLNEMKRCDLVIEAITEDIEIKRQLFHDLENITSPGCILASNSSSIIPSRLSESPEGRKRMIGLHFFYPVTLKNIVEFIIPAGIPDEVVEKTRHFLEVTRKNRLELNEENSFILNKIFLDLQNEAFLLANKEGIAFSRMDAIIKEHLFPLGVFDLCDNVGNDIMLTSVKNYISDYPGKEHYLDFTLKLGQLVNEGRLGVKSGAGFYDYPVREIGIETGIDEHSVEMIVNRLGLVLAASIERFSSQSGISTAVVNNAMKEYLGAENDLVDL